MNVFMIGGTGLLGCEAARQLIAHGHKVTSVALPPLPEGAEMEILFGDINKKTDEEIRDLLKGQDVFIFAAGVDERVEFPAPVSDYYYKFNIAPLERIFPLCKEAGVVMTGPGATHPYHNDPKDSVLRIAPSFPPAEELRKAMEVFCVAVRLAAVEKLLA